MDDDLVLLMIDNLSAMADEAGISDLPAKDGAISPFQMMARSLLAGVIYDETKGSNKRVGEQASALAANVVANNAARGR